MRGIITYGAYVPYYRLSRSDIAATLGGAPGKGTRAVAAYDEDTTTMGFEAARLALKSLAGDSSSPLSASPDALVLATSAPAYLDKTNATAIHAALRLDTQVAAFDMAGSVRCGAGAMHAALKGSTSTLVIASDIRGGFANGADEREGGDGAAAVLVGDENTGEIIAEYLGGASATEEFLDRWRLPGERRSKIWEERFGETKYLDLSQRAWNGALKACELSPSEITKLIVSGPHTRANRSVPGKLGVAKECFANDLSATVGNTGTAHPWLLLANALDEATPGQVIAVVVLADGCDVFIFRATQAIASFNAARTVARQIAAGSEVPYPKYLTWREMLTVEGPRRPDPNRPSGSAAGRSVSWKFGFVGSKDRSSGAIHMPPARVSMKGGAIDEMDPVPMADVPATVVTYTVDRVSYSPSPPILAAILDFDGGGRMPCEVTEAVPEDVKIGDRMEMTFRRLYSSDWIHNYFWKARPVRD